MSPEHVRPYFEEFEGRVRQTADWHRENAREEVALLYDIQQTLHHLLQLGGPSDGSDPKRVARHLLLAAAFNRYTAAVALLQRGWYEAARGYARDLKDFAGYMLYLEYPVDPGKWPVADLLKDEWPDASALLKELEECGADARVRGFAQGIGTFREALNQTRHLGLHSVKALIREVDGGTGTVHPDPVRDLQWMRSVMQDIVYFTGHMLLAGHEFAANGDPKVALAVGGVLDRVAEWLNRHFPEGKLDLRAPGDR